MDYRQKVVDAAVAELRHQLGVGSVSQSGTSLEVDGYFKMARVAEAVIRAALAHDDAIVEEIARNIAPTAADWQSNTHTAIDALTAARAAILSRLDPLP